MKLQKAHRVRKRHLVRGVARGYLGDAATRPECSDRRKSEWPGAHRLACQALIHAPAVAHLLQLVVAHSKKRSSWRWSGASGRG